MSISVWDMSIPVSYTHLDLVEKDSEPCVSGALSEPLLGEFAPDTRIGGSASFGTRSAYARPKRFTDTASMPPVFPRRIPSAAPSPCLSSRSLKNPIPQKFPANT